MAIMTLIPKEAVPVDPKSLRPICLGSATSKVYSSFFFRERFPPCGTGHRRSVQDQRGRRPTMCTQLGSLWT